MTLELIPAWSPLFSLSYRVLFDPLFELNKLCQYYSVM